MCGISANNTLDRINILHANHTVIHSRLDLKPWSIQQNDKTAPAEASLHKLLRALPFKLEVQT